MLNIGLNYTDHFAYMIGYKDGTVRPNANITRAEVATILYRLMTPETRAKYQSTSSTLKDIVCSPSPTSATTSLKISTATGLRAT